MDAQTAHPALAETQDRHSKSRWTERFKTIRSFSHQLVAPLEEDFVTMSAYEPYPGYEPLPGALGEYNGKFMCSQYVLRGGSYATSKTHIRNTYATSFILMRGGSSTAFGWHERFKF